MDSFKIYGNELMLRRIESMITSGKIPSSVLICGEKGLGKTTAALYLAAAVNCEAQTGVPCGRCKSCKTALSGNHPDIIWVKATSKQGNYLVKDDIRPIVADSYIAPNESGRKIYIIDDGEKLNETCQNALLKIFEEPPGESLFILTAKNKQAILPTVLSRVSVMELERVSAEACREALSARGISSEDAHRAEEAFPGNIGMQCEYLGKGKVFDSVVLARNVVSALISGNEYELLKAMSEISTRELASDTAALLFEVLARATEISVGAESMLCCDNEGADKLAAKLGTSALTDVYDCLLKYSERVSGYANLTVLTAATSAELSGIAFR